MLTKKHVVKYTCCKVKKEGNCKAGSSYYMSNMSAIPSDYLSNRYFSIYQAVIPSLAVFSCLTTTSGKNN